MKIIRVSFSYSRTEEEHAHDDLEVPDDFDLENESAIKDLILKKSYCAWKIEDLLDVNEVKDITEHALMIERERAGQLRLPIKTGEIEP